jgi:hypothetical protein
MSDIIIEQSDRKQFKLTIAENRIAIKIPNSYEGTDTDMIVNFLSKVSEEFKYNGHTMRGEYKHNFKHVNLKGGHFPDIVRVKFLLNEDGSITLKYKENLA